MDHSHPLPGLQATRQAILINNKIYLLESRLALQSRHADRLQRDGDVESHLRAEAAAERTRGRLARLRQGLQRPDSLAPEELIGY